MGTRRPRLSRPSTIRGTAAAASSLFTVTRTISEPASARAATCSMVPATSAVSVLVIDCTTTGTSQPMRTCPILTVPVFLRCISAMLLVYLQCLCWKNLNKLQTPPVELLSVEMRGQKQIRRLILNVSQFFLLGAQVARKALLRFHLGGDALRDLDAGGLHGRNLCRVVGH